MNGPDPDRELHRQLGELGRNPVDEDAGQARRSIDEIMLKVQGSPTPPRPRRDARRALILGLMPAAGLAAMALLLLPRGPTGPAEDPAGPAATATPATATATATGPGSAPVPSARSTPSGAATPTAAEPPQEVELRFDDPAARQVTVAGDFNSWSPSSHPLRSENGQWVIRLSLGRGSYRYAFHVTDGSGRVRWVADPRATRRPDGFGGVNAVLRL